METKNDTSYHLALRRSVATALLALLTALLLVLASLFFCLNHSFLPSSNTQKLVEYDTNLGRTIPLLPTITVRNSVMKHEEYTELSSSRMEGGRRSSTPKCWIRPVGAPSRSTPVLCVTDAAAALLSACSVFLSVWSAGAVRTTARARHAVTERTKGTR